MAYCQARWYSLWILIKNLLESQMVYCQKITLDNKFEKNVVYIMNMFLIYLFASMKLEKGHKNTCL